MKRSPMVMALALANLGLAAALVWAVAFRVAPAPAVIARHVTNTVERSHQVVGPPPTTNMAGLTKLWHLVESPDYPVYIANLRALGCPEETIRDIVIADINKLFAERQRGMDPSSRQTNAAWWTAPAYNPKEYQEYNRQVRALNREKRALVKSLLGVDLNQELMRQQGYGNYQDRQLSFLPAEKRAQIQAVNEKWTELEMDLNDRDLNELSNAQRQALYQQYRDQRKVEIAALLTTEELSQYEMRLSPTAQSLRYNLTAFDASEQEYRTIFRLQQAFDEQFSRNLPGVTGEAQQDFYKRREAAQKQLEEELKAVLGTERYTDYKLAQDYNYRGAYEVTRRHQLSKETATAVYEMQKAANAQRTQIMAAPDWTAAQRQEALAALRQSTEQALLNALGSGAYKDYQASAGWWLRTLEQTGVVTRR